MSTKGNPRDSWDRVGSFLSVRVFIISNRLRALARCVRIRGRRTFRSLVFTDLTEPRRDFSRDFFLLVSCVRC